MIVLLTATGLLAVVVGVGLWASLGWDPAEAPEIRETQAPQGGAAGVLRVVTWNVAFGGGAGKQPTERHEHGEVLSNLSSIARVLGELNPDVVFLQEVDRGASRSGNVDQLAALQDTLGYPYACFVTTWRLNYLPFPYWPPSQHLGRVWSGQAILSRHPIASCKRVLLPQPAEYPWWYNHFFLHRALQVARLTLPGDRELTVVNVHLEAFSTANREDQATRLVSELIRVSPDQPVLVAGDFNTVPNDAPQKNHFVDEPETDFSDDQTIATVETTPDLREVFLDDAPTTPPKATLTFPAEAPTRRLDYLFARGLPPSTERRVVPEAEASDHRPVMAVFPLK